MTNLYLYTMQYRNNDIKRYITTASIRGLVVRSFHRMSLILQ